MTLQRPAVLVAALLACAGGAGAQTASAPSHPLTLADAVRLAASGTAAVQVAGFEVDEARAKAGQARAALLPSLTGTASAVNRTFNIRALGFSFPSIPGVAPTPDLIGPVNAVDARVRLNQTVLDPASWVRLGAAGDAVRVSDAERGGSVESAANDAALAWLRATRAQAVVTARERDLELADALTSLANDQLGAGVSPGIDVTRARTEAAAAHGQALVARNQLARARIDLARALGLDPAAPPQIGDTLSTASGISDVPDSLAPALAVAIARRPELRIEAMKLRRARHEGSAIAAERLPRVDVEADYGVSGETGPDALATRQFGVALTVPLLDGLRREARIAEQRSVARESEVRTRDLRAQVAAEVGAALLDIASGQEQERVALEQLTLAEEELAQARERFASGVAGNIEVINAQAALNRARDVEIDARYATALGRIGLARAAGVTTTLR